ncbi:DUF3231 family protein [Scopulibacillus cellulosilyticus]|uniref:DUF3231 family protein n=1 Tax=Scopulibacillus cellulosilyticus TaxID=2665665 RepID=A0ABW2PWC2_9BACL
MKKNHDRLTSPEISNLWAHYINETLQICIIKYMLKTIKDPEIRRVYKMGYEISLKHIKTLESVFYQENFPVPKGFSDEDVNLDAPPLFTDIFCINYIHTMSMHGMQGYGLGFSISIRKDIRQFYHQCNLDTMEIYNKSLDVLLEKQLYDKPPFYTTPDHVSFIKNLTYVADVLGTPRKINTLEAGNIYFNLQKSTILKGLLIAFKQVCKDKEVCHYLQQCIKITNKHLGLFSNILLKDDLHSPRSLESEITTSNIAPFSNKLMMFHVGFLIAAASAYYGNAALTSMRADIFMHCQKAVAEDLIQVARFSKIATKRNWLEKPPEASDRTTWG